MQLSSLDWTLRIKKTSILLLFYYFSALKPTYNFSNLMNTTDNTYKISATMFASLEKEVQALNNVILQNPLIPILENFLLKIENNEIVLAGSDNQTSIVSRIPLEGKSKAAPLEIAVPARMLKDTLKNLPKQPVDLSIDKERYNITLQTSNGRYKIACENGDDFPDIFDFPEGEADVLIPMDILQKAFKFTLFAASKDERRPELSGVLISVGKEGLSFVATDGNRLVRYTRKEITTNNPFEVIVPVKALQLMKQLLTGNSDKKIRLIAREKQLFIAWDHVQLIVSLIKEKYPDYENVIPKHNNHRLILSTDCLSTVKRIAIYANRTTPQLSLDIQKDSAKVTAKDPAFSNEAHETIACKYDGPNMVVGFNAKLLVEMLGILPTGEEIQFALDTPNRAVLVEPPTSTDKEEIVMLIMPMLLNH